MLLNNIDLQDLRYNKLRFVAGVFDLRQQIICFYIEVTYLVTLVKSYRDPRKKKM